MGRGKAARHAQDGETLPEGREPCSATASGDPAMARVFPGVNDSPMPSFRAMSGNGRVGVNAFPGESTGDSPMQRDNEF